MVVSGTGGCGGAHEMLDVGLSDVSSLRVRASDVN